MYDIRFKEYFDKEKAKYNNYKVINYIIILLLLFITYRFIFYLYLFIIHIKNNAICLIKKHSNTNHTIHNNLDHNTFINIC